MDSAKPGHSVEFRGLKGDVRLNGTRGRLVEFLKKEQRWAVRCLDDHQIVNAKPANLKRVADDAVPAGRGEIYQHPLTGHYLTPRTTSKPVTDPTTVINNYSSLHDAVLGAFYTLKKGGVIVSCGDKYMMAIEFDGPYGNGGIYGEMAYADRDPSAQAVVRGRNCQRATELGRNFLAGETIHYIDTTDEDLFFSILSEYQRKTSTQGLIDVKSGLKLYSVQIAK